MEINVNGYTLVRKDERSKILVYRAGRLICTVTTMQPVDDTAILNIVSLISARERGEI